MSNNNNNNNLNNDMAFAFAVQIVERDLLRRVNGLAQNTHNHANLEEPRPIIEARREPLLRMPTPVYVRVVNGGMAARVPARPAYNVDFE